MTNRADSAASLANETNPLTVSGKNLHDHLKTFSDEPVSWDDDRLDRVTRLRLISDPGFPFWDVSYAWGVLEDGTRVHVLLPFSQLPKGRVSRAIVEHAKRDGVYAKGLGILENISTLT